MPTEAADDKYAEALKVAQSLQDLDDDSLLEQLGLRINDITTEGGWERALQYDGDFGQTNAEDLLGWGDVTEIGRRWWKKSEKKLMEIICGKDQTEFQKITSGKTIPQIAASLATAAVVSAFAAPAWLIIATTIIASKIAEAGLESVCEVWRESQPAVGGN